MNFPFALSDYQTAYTAAATDKSARTYHYHTNHYEIPVAVSSGEQSYI